MFSERAPMVRPGEDPQAFRAAEQAFIEACCKEGGIELKAEAEEAEKTEAEKAAHSFHEKRSAEQRAAWEKKAAAVAKRHPAGIVGIAVPAEVASMPEACDVEAAINRQGVMTYRIVAAGFAGT